MEDEAIRTEISIAFEYCYLHEDWVNPLKDALKGVTAEGALWRPKDGMGIWDIVLHLAVWNENIVERTKSREKAHPSEGAWPPIPQPPTEEAWHASKQRLWSSLESVQTLLRTATLEELQSAPYGIADLLCRMTHMGYHLGQITKLRECVSLPEGQ